MQPEASTLPWDIFFRSTANEIIMPLLHQKDLTIYIKEHPHIYTS